MCEIKKILRKVFVLAIDIFLFAFNTIRQIILPGKRKRGNLLSSLFIFFVGIIERFDSFEYGVFRMANLLKLKYIKRSLLIIAGFYSYCLPLNGQAKKISAIIQEITPYSFLMQQ